MYGLVNAAIQEIVCGKFGEDKWNEIKKMVGVQGMQFSRMESYPDAMTYKLVEATSKTLGLSPDQVLEAFGEFWVLYTGKEGYGHLFKMTGDNLRDFLINLDNLHTRVGQNFTNLQPPSFSFNDEDDGRLRMHYHSDRPGLCPMVRGLVKGLSEMFHTRTQVEHPVCSREGADHCEFLLKMEPENG
jgi:predicted hydrocarbon binding protein